MSRSSAVTPSAPACAPAPAASATALLHAAILLASLTIVWLGLDLAI